MAPAIHLPVMVDAGFSVGFRGDDGTSSAPVEGGAEPIDIEGPVAQQGIEGGPLDQRRHADRVIPLPRQQDEAHQIAQGIDQGHSLRRLAAARAADGLILSPPFAPLAF